MKTEQIPLQRLHWAKDITKTALCSRAEITFLAYLAHYFIQGRAVPTVSTLTFVNDQGHNIDQAYSIQKKTIFESGKHQEFGVASHLIVASRNQGLLDRIYSRCKDQQWYYRPFNVSFLGVQRQSNQPDLLDINSPFFDLLEKALSKAQVASYDQLYLELKRWVLTNPLLITTDELNQPKPPSIFYMLRRAFRRG